MSFLNRLTGHRGRQNLRGEDEYISYTQYELDEISRCMDSPLYFIKNYVKIVHVDRGLVPFDMYPFQEKMIEILHNNRFVIGLCPRQVGKTTTLGCYLLWFILFNEDKSVAILANKAATAQEIMSRLQKAFENLPKFLQQGVKTWNKRSIELSNGSKMFADATSGSAIRGRTFNILLLDEFAHVENNLSQEFFNSTIPTISSGNTTKIFVISTPRGLNLFHKIWTDSVTGKNDYARIEVK